LTRFGEIRVFAERVTVSVKFSVRSIVLACTWWCQYEVLLQCRQWCWMDVVHGWMTCLRYWSTWFQSQTRCRRRQTERIKQNGAQRWRDRCRCNYHL